jgi:hypothetical protein
VMTIGGWVLGGMLSVIVLTFLKDSVFRAKGLFINPTDIWAYQHTIPIPFCISAFAVMTIAIRLLRLDPVSVIEKR